MAVRNNKHELHKALAKELESASKVGKELKAEKIDNHLHDKSISIQKKKEILLGLLHRLAVQLFASKPNQKKLNAFKTHLNSIRKIIHKLRSINHYLETIFQPKASWNSNHKKEAFRPREAMAQSELELLEYTAYKLIAEAASLDKKALQEYSAEEKKTAMSEALESKDIKVVLKNQTHALEHLEAKIPPAKAASAKLLKEPLFTHWASRVLALLVYIEHLHARENGLAAKLRKNREMRKKLGSKIRDLQEEKAKLIHILQKKSESMSKNVFEKKMREELHNFTATVDL